MERIVLAALHLLALGIGFGAIIARWITLRRPLTPDAIKRVFHFDTQWGIAAALWIVTGVWRWLGSVEKTASYYPQNHWFLAKMGFFLLIFALEIMPMLTLMKWRGALARGADLNTLLGLSRAKAISTISAVQAVLVVGMVVFATMMARGYGVVAR